MPSTPSFDLLTIVGNRPQFVKMAALSAELSARGRHEFVVHTGQHFDDNMSRVFFEELSLPRPDLNLDIAGGSHGEMTGRMLIRLEQVLLETKPRNVLLYGDTNSTLAGALAAVKLHIPFAHVEAGPRLYDMTSPEEVNRLVADHTASLRFCPDQSSVENLAKENITTGVYFTGDVMYDTFLRFSKVAAERSTIVDTMNLRGERFALLTVHRPNNTDDAAALSRLVDVLVGSSLPIVFLVHPRTQYALKRFNRWEPLTRHSHMRISPALGYLDTLQLVNHAEIILTDSGGLQKEAFFAGKPGITLFTSPWPTLEAAGWQTCVWRNGQLDVPAAMEAIERFRPAAARPQLFGDGRAAAKIVDLLEQHGWFDAAGSAVD
jgi:UDP-GlcNAc3NAcA epimerase